MKVLLIGLLCSIAELGMIYSWQNFYNLIPYVIFDIQLPILYTIRGFAFGSFILRCIVYYKIWKQNSIHHRLLTFSNALFTVTLCFNIILVAFGATSCVFSIFLMASDFQIFRNYLLKDNERLWQGKLSMEELDSVLYRGMAFGLYFTYNFFFYQRLLESFIICSTVLLIYFLKVAGTPFKYQLTFNIFTLLLFCGFLIDETPSFAQINPNFLMPSILGALLIFDELPKLKKYMHFISLGLFTLFLEIMMISNSYENTHIFIFFIPVIYAIIIIVIAKKNREFFNCLIMIYTLIYIWLCWTEKFMLIFYQTQVWMFAFVLMHFLEDYRRKNGKMILNFWALPLTRIILAVFSIMSNQNIGPYAIEQEEKLTLIFCMIEIFKETFMYFTNDMNIDVLIMNLVIYLKFCWACSDFGQILIFLIATTVFENFVRKRYLEEEKKSPIHANNVLGKIEDSYRSIEIIEPIIIE